MAGAETVTEATAEVDAAKFVSPAYAEVMECGPTARVEVVNVAEPDELSVPVPICVAPSRNETLPVGTPEPDWGVTVVVNVTDWPEVISVADADRDVFDAASVALAGVKTKTVAEYAGKL